MKTFDKLTETQRIKAIAIQKDQILRFIIEQDMSFGDTGKSGSIDDRIEQAWKYANRMQTPWFIHEYIADMLGQDLEDLARDRAEGFSYNTEPGYIPVVELYEPEL